MNFVKLVSDYDYDLYVVAAAYSFDMTTHLRNKSVFETYGTARYAADVTFQQTSRPRGNMEEGKRTTEVNISYMDIGQKYQFFQTVLQSLVEITTLDVQQTVYFLKPF